MAIVFTDGQLVTASDLNALTNASNINQGKFAYAQLPSGGGMWDNNGYLHLRLPMAGDYGLRVINPTIGGHGLVVQSVASGQRGVIFACWDNAGNLRLHVLGDGEVAVPGVLLAGSLGTTPLNASSLSSGNMPYARMPTGSGVWTVGGTASVSGQMAGAYAVNIANVPGGHGLQVHCGTGSDTLLACYDLASALKLSVLANGVVTIPGILNAGGLGTTPIPGANVTGRIAWANLPNTLGAWDIPGGAFTVNATPAAGNFAMFLTSTVAGTHGMYVRTVGDGSEMILDCRNVSGHQQFTVYANGFVSAPISLSAGTLYEKGRTTPIGHWINVPYNAANFATNNADAWNVGPGTLFTNTYTLIGKTLFWSLYISGSYVSGGSNYSSLVLTPPVPILYRHQPNAVILKLNGVAVPAELTLYDPGRLHVYRTDVTETTPSTVELHFTATLEIA